MNYMGIDLGGTNLRCAVVAADHTLLSRVQVSTPKPGTPDRVIDAFAGAMHEAAKLAGVDLRTVCAAGAGVPGQIDQTEGVVRNVTNLPSWHDVPLARSLHAKTGVPVFIDNDASCAGWGEYVAGAGKGCRNMIMITLGTGIGGAGIVNGSLIRGRDGAAGEYGHICIEMNGRPCPCGARGCAEAYASANSVVRRFREFAVVGRATSLAEKGDAVTCHDIFTAAGAGDALSSEVVADTATCLGTLIASLAEALNPERCVLFGGMARAGEDFYNAIRTACRSRNNHIGLSLDIVPSELGPDAGLIGAADYARTRSGK